MKRTERIAFTIILICIFLITECTPKNKEKNTSVTIFSAAATIIPVTEIADSFSSVYSIGVEKNFAASGILARQIYNGAKADLFISANKEWIDYLVDRNLLIDTLVDKLAENMLVVICHKSKIVNLDFSADFNIKSIIPDKIAIGDPSYVPAGKYAQQALNSLGWYSDIKDRIILTKDVASVLNLVELNECDWGIVYYSEAIKSEKINIIAEIPENLYDPIVFYVALLKNSNKESFIFYDYLKTRQAKEIMSKYGLKTDC